MQEARRGLIDVLVPVGLELTGDYAAALDLVGSQYALANGYAVLAARGLFIRRDEALADVTFRARRATLALVAGWGR